MDKSRLFSGLKHTLISVCFGIAAMLLFIGIFAFIISKITAPQIVINILVIIALCVGAAVSGYLNGALQHEKGIIVGAVSGAVLAFILFIAKLIFSDGAITLMTVVKIIILLVCACICGIAGVNRRSKKYAKIK